MIWAYEQGYLLGDGTFTQSGRNVLVRHRKRKAEAEAEGLIVQLNRYEFGAPLAPGAERRCLEVGWLLHGIITTQGQKALRRHRKKLSGSTQMTEAADHSRWVELMTALDRYDRGALPSELGADAFLALDREGWLHKAAITGDGYAALARFRKERPEPELSDAADRMATQFRCEAAFALVCWYRGDDMAPIMATRVVDYGWLRADCSLPRGFAMTAAGRNELIKLGVVPTAEQCQRRTHHKYPPKDAQEVGFADAFAYWYHDEDAELAPELAKRLLELGWIEVGYKRPYQITFAGNAHLRKMGVTPRGRKDDSGKERWSLLPLNAMHEVVKVFTFGARKYSDHGWRKVDNWQERYYDAAQRHMTSYRLGETNDPETGLHHLAHASCCILIMLARSLNCGGKP